MSDAAIANLVTALVTVTTMVVGFLTLWVKLRYGVEQTENVKKQASVVEKKLDDNTAITRAGTTAAAVNAKVAANNATEAKVAAQSIDKKLNGGLESTISNAITPIQKSIDEHSLSDEKNMTEINKKFNDLTDYVHQRNHDLLNAMSAQSIKIETIIVMIQKQQEKNK